MRFIEKSGSNCGSAPTFQELNRVYLLDDFESYPDRGTGFTGDQTSIFSASNLRGTYYVDAGSGSGNTWVSGSSFKIPSTANYLNLSSSGTGPVHNGSKAMLLQGQKAGWVRAWRSEVFNQNQHYNFGSGTRLSFWAYSGRNNADGTGSNTSNVKIRAQAYYQNFSLTDSNRNSTTYGTGTKDFTISSGSGWTECKIDLDPSKSVYAINLMIDNSSCSTDYVFVPIDDITIYTEPIYEPTKQYIETNTKITKSYHGSVTFKVGFSSTTFTIKVALGANDYIYAYAGVDMQPTSYTINGSQIVIVTTGSYEGKTFGTWTGTFSNNNKTITIQKSNITGSITSYMSSSSVTLTENTVLVDGSEGSLSALETKIQRQYYSGSSWTTDTGNADRLSINSAYYIQGTNSIRVRPYNSGNSRVIALSSFMSSNGPLDSVAFWFYAPAGTRYKISVYSYKTTDATGDYEQKTYKEYEDGDPEAAGGSGWHYFDLGLNKAGGYGRSFSIWIGTNSKQTILDYITYFK